MLRLVVLSCLLAAAAAQTRYFCDSSSSKMILDSDFYLVTRRSGEQIYLPGMSCEFNAITTNSQPFFIEVTMFQVSTATLTITSGTRVLFRGSSIPKFQTSIVTTSDSLKVRFETAGDYSRNRGVELRVRALDRFGCPPGWVRQYGSCYGSGNYSGRLNFADAQKACNSMRSNLLQLPSNYSGYIITFLRTLPTTLTASYTWVGLTERTTSGQFKLFWLNGASQYSTLEISCVSGGSYRTCLSQERCGTARLWSSSIFEYALFMENCLFVRDFVCSMPEGGTDRFYAVPNYTAITGAYTFRSSLIYGIVIAVLFVTGLVVGIVYSVGRTAARARGAASPTAVVVVPASRVQVPPPPTAYPQQPQPQTVPPYTAQMAAQYKATAPPSYEAAVAASGYANVSYAK